ncbi:hypothetical protein CDAR_615361 [Caerostris darwini]|uniref:Uncharacterized protein n=1 Tax=Caerostris darwini TaxID=1538125 RepID=A0AAV4RZ94_9ARAC|nr:hypothetical protein CDAR_615361 [Caerostris darwini]
MSRSEVSVFLKREHFRITQGRLLSKTTRGPSCEIICRVGHDKELTAERSENVRLREGYFPTNVLNEYFWGSNQTDFVCVSKQNRRLSEFDGSDIRRRFGSIFFAITESETGKIMRTRGRSNVIEATADAEDRRRARGR